MSKDYEEDNVNYKGMEESFRQQPMMNQQPFQQPTMYQPGMYQPGMYQPEMNYMDDIDEKEMEYMKKMYPDFCQRIQRHVEYECDRMDYDGSPMYGEYPDQETIEQMIDKVYERTAEEMPELLEETDMDRQRIPRFRLVRSLAGALLLSELFGRRRLYRRRSPYFGSPFYQTPYYQYPYYQKPYYQYPYQYY